MKLPENGSGRPRGIESLYPFLFASQKDRGAVTEEVRRSTREQALEIVAIRDRLAVGLDTRLTECAQALARKTLEEGGQSDTDRLSYAFRRALSRPPPRCSRS